MTIAFIQGIGVPELLIVLAIVVVFFGGRRLPQLGRGLGDGIRGFKDSLTSGDGRTDDTDPDPTIGTDADPVEPIVDGEIVRDRS